MKLVSVLIEHPIHKISDSFYYLFNGEISKGVRVKVNFNNQNIIGFVIEVKNTNKTKEELKEEFGFEIKYIDEVIDETPIFSQELLNLASIASERFFYPLIGVLQAMVPPSLRPNSRSLNEAKIKYVTYYKINEDIDDKCLNLNKTSLKLLEEFKLKKIIEKKEISSKKKSIEALLSNNLIHEEKQEEYRYKILQTFKYEDKIELNEKQNDAFLNVINSEKICSLLYGVTGSGKTEVYIKLAEYFIKNGGSALILVPEIALTPLMISRILSYFDKDIIGIIHSSLTSAESYDEYRKILNGQSKIVIGTRSAIFAPLKDLKLICIDEEHDDSYYQSDNFSYNTIDIALIRAKLSGAKVVLGSATPSIETMSKAKSNRYQLLELPQRFNKIDLPKAQIINSGDRKNFSFKSSIFSIYLIQKIKETLLNNEQVILLINTKGFSRNMTCRECNYIFTCPKCGSTLFYHKENNTLRCHHCEYKIKKPTTCPECGSKNFIFNGIGIEQVEEEFKKIFNVNYLSLDGDRITKTLQISTILQDFNDKKANVLIGTQIVAKGHDFKNVSLIGVINCDNSLFVPSYKSRENLFQLIYQVIGRCGRGEKRGEAVIQTNFPNDFAIIFATAQDYDSFYDEEIKNRKSLKYPPFYYLVKIQITSKDIKLIKENQENIKNFFKDVAKNAIILKSNDIIFFQNNYRSSILIKIKDYSEIKDSIKMLLDIYKRESKIRIKILLNPPVIN